MPPLKELTAPSPRRKIDRFRKTSRSAQPTIESRQEKNQEGKMRFMQAFWNYASTELGLKVHSKGKGAAKFWDNQVNTIAALARLVL